MQCATHERSLPQPDVLEVLDRCGTPNVSPAKVSSSGSSARWVCSRTSSRSASSAVAHHQLGRDRERRARRQGDAHHGAPATGRGAAPTSRSESARISSSSCTTESGGRPPSFCDRLIEPRVGWKRMPSSAAAAISAVIRSPRPGGVDVEVVGRWWCSRRGPARPARPRPRRRPPPRRGGSTAGTAWSASRRA